MKAYAALLLCILFACPGCLLVFRQPYAPPPYAEPEPAPPHEEPQPQARPSPEPQPPPRRSRRRERPPQRTVPALYVLSLSSGHNSVEFHGAAGKENMKAVSVPGYFMQIEGIALLEMKTRRPETRTDIREGFGLRMKYYSMDLKRSQFHCGAMELLDVVMEIRGFTKSDKYTAVGGNWSIGLGLAFTDFDNDPEYDLWRSNFGEPPYDVRTGAGGVFSVGGGVDFYNTPTSCISLSVAFEHVRIPVDWNDFYSFSDRINWLNLSHFQFTLGMRFFF